MSSTPQSKPWWKSRTIAVGATAVLLGVGDAVVAGETNWRSLAIAGIGAAVAYLRTQTNQPVRRRTRKPKDAGGQDAGGQDAGAGSGQ